MAWKSVLLFTYGQSSIRAVRCGCEYSLLTAIVLLYTGSNDLSMGIVLGVGGWLAIG